MEDAVHRGATVVYGGGRMDGEGFNGGYFFSPTVLAGVTDDMVITREETFGPVIPLLSFQSVDEVVTRAKKPSSSP